MKEIVIEERGDTSQQSGIYAFTLEDAIDIGAVATELGGQPRGGSTLLMKNFFNLLSDVNHTQMRQCITKRRKLSVTRFFCWLPPSDLHDKQARIVHTPWCEPSSACSPSLNVWRYSQKREQEQKLKIHNSSIGQNASCLS